LLDKQAYLASELGLLGGEMVGFMAEAHTRGDRSAHHEEIPRSSSEPGSSGVMSSGAESIARISVSLPRSLCREFRLHALDQDTTLSALMARLIRQEINSMG
jgi:hypothetical protein